MTEPQATSALSDRLRKSGFVVFKISDQFTAGIPDMAIVGMRRTTWVEVKLIKRSKPPREFRFSFIKPGPQLWNMMRLQDRAAGKYLLMCFDGTLHLADVMPGDVHRSATKGDHIELKWETMSEWITRMQSEIS